MENMIWFNKPATKFVEALPIGNGKMGAMIYGAINNEKIALNMDEFWSGTGKKEETEISENVIQRVREEIFAGNYKSAERLIKNNIYLSYTESYMPVGDLRFSYKLEGCISDYKRYLDMKNGKVVTSFRLDGKEVVCDAYASLVQNVIILHIQSEKK